MTYRRAAAAALLLLLPAIVSAQEGRRRNRIGEDAHIRIGSNYDLPAGAMLRGGLVVIGGSVTLNGTVQDDVNVVGGRVEVGPNAVIEGDVRTLGGRIDVAPNAIVRGNLRTLGGRIRIDPAAQVTGEVEEVRNGTIRGFPIEVDGLGGRVMTWLAAWLTILRLSVAFVIGLLLTLLGPGFVRNIGHRLETTPGVSFLAGAATEIFAAPACGIIAIALVITIVGIPLLALIPIAMGALLLLAIAGFTAVATRVGAAIVGGGGALSFVAGFVALTAVTIASQVASVAPGSLFWVMVPLSAIGLAIEYVAWTIGLGAALVFLFNRHRAVVPPPLPPPLPPDVGGIGASAPA